MEGYHKHLRSNDLRDKLAIGKTYHRSVLLKQAVEALKIKRGSWYLDCTLGDGGHSLEILKLGGRIVGVDVDPQAIDRTRERFREFSVGDYKLIQGNFRELENLISRTQKFAGAIFDLGVSSLQLEDAERGFSFSKEGPLDMRMDPGLGVTALDLVNVLSKEEIYELFKSLGEEKYSWKLASALVRARQVGIRTTKDLAEIVERAVGRKRATAAGRHPATRVFQALRIAVNDELNALKEGLAQVKSLIKKNGRIVVISFHSLEDRIVKDTFKRWWEEGRGVIITKKPITPSDYETKQNPRSRSAKMRIFKIL